MKAAMGRSVVLRWLPECHPHLAMRIQGDHPRDGSSWIHGGLITSPSVTVPLASCEPDRSRLRADCERAVIVDGIWDSIWAYLDSTTVVASLHATSSLSFPQHRTPAFQAWLVHLRERSSRMQVEAGVLNWELSSHSIVEGWHVGS